MVAVEGIGRTDLSSGVIRAGNGTGSWRAVPPKYRLWRSNNNKICVAVYKRGLVACMHLVKPFAELSLHNTDSMSTGYLLTLLSSMFLLTKTLQVPAFSFLPFSLFEDTCYNFLTPGSNYCTCAGVSVELLYSWGLWKCPFWMFTVPTGRVSGILGSVTLLNTCYADLHVCSNFNTF